MRARILGFIAVALVAFGVVGCVGGKDELGSVEQAVVDPPTNLVANVVSGYQVNLSWDPVAGADFYVIKKGNAPGTETTFTSTSAASTTFTDDHLTPLTQYAYQVTAVIGPEESPPSNEVVFTTPAGIAPPTNVMAMAISTTRIDVSWTAAAGASKYYLFRATGAGPFAYVTTVVGTSYANMGLTPSTTYSFMLHSADDAGRESGDSNIATAMTPGTPPQIDPPMTVTATAVSSSRIEVSWSTAPNAVKYYVFQAQGAGPFSYVGTMLGTDYSATGLAASTTYSYVIQAVDALDVASADSAPPATATTFGTGSQAGVPTGVTATAISSSRINVSWTASANSVKYYVFRALGSGTMAYIGTAFSTSFLDTGLAASTTYSYEVQGVDSNDIASASSTPRAFATTFAEGLGARFKFDEQSGSSTTDSVGGRVGTLSGGAAFASTDKPPVYDEDFHNYSYISFPGGANDAVSVPEDFQFTDDQSVSFWAQLPSGGAGTVHLMGKRAAACGAIQWDLYQDGTGLHLASDTTTLNFGASIPAATWTQVGVTFDGTTARLYVNGVETASGAWAAGPRQAVPVQFGNSGSCGNGAQLFLDEVRVYTTALTPTEMGRLGIRPAAPSNMTGMSLSSTAASFSWDAVASAELYVIYRGDSPAVQTAYTSLVNSSTTFLEDHLTPSQTTSWHIRVVVNGLLSLPSNVVTVTTDPPPSPPATVSVMANSGDPLRAEISWTAVANAQKYYVFVSVNGGATTFLNTVVAPGTTLSHAGLTSGSSYSYTVVTVDQGNTESAPSTPAIFTP
jgi:fibronectin type 3 domain-containing protein